VQYDRVLAIPTGDRITALAERDRESVFTALLASLGGVMQNLNLRYGFNEEQLCDLAECIIDESSEDNLALEDVLLFLQQLLTGKGGKIYDRLDMPTFFYLFETYREQRHNMYVNMQYEKDCNYKALGDRDRWSNDIEKDKNREAMNAYLKHSYGDRQGDNQEVCD